MKWRLRFVVAGTILTTKGVVTVWPSEPIPTWEAWVLIIAGLVVSALAWPEIRNTR